MLTYAQNFEDVILARLFTEQDTGFYIDVGACHPNDLSVTKHFYDLGWRGVNVEPIPKACRLFDEIRPRDINLNAAIDVVAGDRKFFEVIEFDALSTFDVEQAEFLRKSGYHLNEYSVKTITLNTVFEQYVNTDVDFLKIDVEGSEESVLNSLNLALFRPRILLIEATLPARGFPGWSDCEKFASWEWEDLVTQSGYIFALFDGISRYYVRNEDAYLLPRFKLPVGFFDSIKFAEDFLLAQQAKAENEILIEKISNLERQLHGLIHMGIRGRVKSLLGYSKRRFKKIIHAGLWRIAGKTTTPVLPKITVVTPVFNGEAHIVETLESVLRQDYPALEYIVVDGGSSDGTLDIIRSYENRGDLPQRITLVISEPDQGMYDAIAKGFEKATGEIFCYLNADDLFECGGLRTVGEHFAQHLKDQVIYHEDVVLVDGWKYPNIRQPEGISTADLLSGHILFQDGVFWRRNAYEAIGGVRRDLKLAGDFDLWLRLSAHFRFVKRPGHVSCFRVREGQLSTQMDRYHDEMQQSIKDFLSTARGVKRMLCVVQKVLRLVIRVFSKGRHHERLLFPIDFGNLPPPKITISPEIASIPKSPIDGQPAERLLFSTPDTRFGDKEINYVYLDTRHGVAITHPPIASDKLDGLYRKYYSSPPTDMIFPQGTSPYRQFNGKRIWEKILLRLPVERLARFAPNGWADNTLSELFKVLKASQVNTKNELRFLDTGCFEGHLLDQIREKTAWKAFGLEPNDNAVELARGKGHKVWHCHAEYAVDIIPQDQQFDIIFMGQSIEHVDDPVRVLRRLRLLLAPGGVLVMSTPNLDSREIDWFGPTWAHWHTPFHRFIFSRKGLIALAQQVGLMPINFQSFSHPYWTTMSIAHNWMGLGGSASHAVNFDRNFAMRAQRVNFWQNLLWNRLGKGDYCFISMKDSADE